jgi:hypothetical protein
MLGFGFARLRDMSRLMSISILERSAAADLCRNTLSRIATVFGRLEYLASLRNPNSGIYEHHGLASIYGPRDSRRALAQSHQDVFQDWLNLPLAEKILDLRSYVNLLDDPTAFLEYWTQGPPSSSYLPQVVHRAEKTLFFDEFEILLEVLKGNLEAASRVYSRPATRHTSKLLSRTPFLLVRKKPIDL